MLPDRVSNPGPLTYESGALPIALHGPARALQLSYNIMLSNKGIIKTELPQSGKNIWKMKFFPSQGKVREFCGWPGKFRKDLESQGTVREINCYDRIFCLMR